ncbi:MAG: DUF1559 domain-containing protein [Planctomycetota bacterium]
MRFVKRMPHTAFTLVELLVVISIIGVLVSLLLPAVQSARESARRMSCTNQMRNLGIAALNYHDVERHFPISRGYTDADGQDGSGPATGWILEVLPQLEQQVLYDQFERGGAFNGNWAIGRGQFPGTGFGLGSNENGISVPELMATPFGLLNCPSDGNASLPSTNQYGWDDVPVTLTSYKGVIGDTVVNPNTESSSFVNTGSLFPSGDYQEPPPSHQLTEDDCHRDTRCRGIFFRQSWRRPVKIARITDGTSNTLMIGEDVPDYDRHSAAFYSDGDWCSCNIPLNHLVGTTPPSPDDPADPWWNHRGFRSLHPGGANFVLADGSGRFVSETVDNVAYRTACTRNSGELVNEEL